MALSAIWEQSHGFRLPLKSQGKRSRAPPIAPVNTRAKSMSEKKDEVLDGVGNDSAHIPPIKDNLPGLAGDHGVETPLKIAISKAMRNDGGNIDT